MPAFASPLQAAAQSPAQPAAPPTVQSSTWEQLSRMQLERQFAGPLKDTIVQRWRDPGNGTVCYIYLPITASHSPPTPGGYVQYGPNAIGSISCVAVSGTGSAQVTSGRPVAATPASPAVTPPATSTPKRP
jgi:hypothetical protein